MGFNCITENGYIKNIIGYNLDLTEKQRFTSFNSLLIGGLSISDVDSVLANV